MPDAQDYGHEGYHHGHIKLALKQAGRPVPDEEAGPVTWASGCGRSELAKYSLFGALGLSALFLRLSVWTTRTT